MLMYVSTQQLDCYAFLAYTRIILAKNKSTQIHLRELFLGTCKKTFFFYMQRDRGDIKVCLKDGYPILYHLIIIYY